MNLISFFPAITTKPSTLIDAVDSMFNEFFNRDFPVSFNNGFIHRSPAVNIVETNDAFRLEVAAPGLSKEDFEVKVDNDMLSISAHKETKNEQKDEKYTRREFNYFEFRRNFHLPESINPNNIKASYENGVLNVILEKKPEAKPVPARVIAIN